jgi:hypothetical protein
MLSRSASQPLQTAAAVRAAEAVPTTLLRSKARRRVFDDTHPPLAPNVRWGDFNDARPSPSFQTRDGVMASARRLRFIQHALAPSSQVIGTLTLGDISYPVPASATPLRLPHIRVTPLDPNGPCTCEHLYFLLQKVVLGLDVFSQVPMRRPAPTFCGCERTSLCPRLAVVSMARQHGKCKYEYIALHCDVGETELKQAREIREGGNLVQCHGACCQDGAYPYHRGHREG